MFSDEYEFTLALTIIKEEVLLKALILQNSLLKVEYISHCEIQYLEKLRLKST